MANNTLKASKVYDISSQLDLDNAEAINSWTGGTDVSNIATSTTHVTGSKSISFDKTGTTLTTASISKIIGGENGKNGNIFAIQRLMLQLNLSDLTNVASVSLIIGTDVSNNNVYTTADTALSTGWNELKYNCDSPTSVTGSGVNWYEIKYVQVKVTFDAAANTLASILVDTIYLFKANASGSASANVNIELVDGSTPNFAQETGGNLEDIVNAIATDDSAQSAAPAFVNVGGEYRVLDTIYADGDAAILQQDVNGKLKVSGVSSGAGGSGILVGSQRGTYTFDASAKEITLVDIKTLKLEEILQIVNVTTNVVIYSPQDIKLGGSIASNIITLTYDTTAMSDTDDLAIRIEYNNSEDYDLGVKKTLPQGNASKIVTSPEPLVSATPYELTASFADVGSEIYVGAYESITLWVTLDIGTSTNPQLRILNKHTSAGTEEYREIYLGSPATNLTTINLNDYEIASDEDQLFPINIKTNGAIYMQTQAKDDANGDGQIDALYVTKVPR